MSSLAAPPGGQTPSDPAIPAPVEPVSVKRQVSAPVPVSTDVVASVDGAPAAVKGVPVSVSVVSASSPALTTSVSDPSVATADTTAAVSDVAVVDGSVTVDTVAGSTGAVKAVGVSPVSTVDVKVQSFDASTVSALGGEVLAFGLTPPADLVAKGGVDAVVRVDYSQFRWALGADWAQRLQLVEWQCDPLTAQASTKECGNPVPVAGVVNDLKSGTLTATVRLDGQAAAGPAGASRPGVTTGDGSTLGLASAEGSFAATTLSNSGQWQVGGNTGSFTYSYPIATPPAFNGLGPSVALAYDSSAVDGVTSSVNSQPGEVGLGWSLSAGQGFVERRYLPCTDSRIGGGTTDSCWYVQNATISLNGHASELVPINGTTGTPNSFTQFRLKEDPNWLVERVPSPTGDWWSSEYWKVTTPDGMVYTFGRSDEGQNSRLVRPLRGLGSTDPCYAKANKLCTDMPYRWLLDRVQDPFGNVMIYKYNVVTNRARTLGSGYSAVDYDLNAVLAEIDYGKTDPNRTPAPVIGSYRDRVRFTYVTRCVEAKWTAGACNDISNTYGTSYPDVPTDLYCPTGNCFKDVSFFSTKRLAVITTETSANGTTWDAVAQWRLYHGFPDPGDGGSEKMWLDAIYRVSTSDSTSNIPATASPIDLGTAFVGVFKQNRKDGNPSAGVPFMNEMRIANITDALGQRVDVTYESPDCSLASPNWSTNTTNCFPMYAGFTGGGAGWGAYRRWVVDKVDVRDLVTNPIGAVGNAISPIVTYDYTYTGAAWHHDGTDWWEDTPGIDDVSWGQWRGYRQVVTTIGTGTTKTVTKQIFYQGMNGDKAATGTKTVTMTKSWTTTSEGTGTNAIYDEDWLSGQVFESFQMDGTTSSYLSAQRNQSTWNRSDTGTQVVTSIPAVQYRKWAITLAYKRLTDPAGPNGFYDSRTDTSVDAYGRTTAINATGFLSLTGDETCTRYRYLNNSAPPTVGSIGWMNLTVGIINYAALGTQPTHPYNSTNPAGGTCTSQPTSETRNFYNGNAFYSGTLGVNAQTLDARAQGVPASFKPFATTSLTRIKNWNTATDDLTRWTYTQQAFDSVGRTTSSTDANGNATTFSFDTTFGYTSQAIYPVGSLTTQTVLRPGDGQPSQTTDQNNLTTYYCYDNLSRIVAVFAPLQSGPRTGTDAADPCGAYPGFTGTAYQVPTAKFGYYLGWYDTNRTAKVPAIVVSSTLLSGTTDPTDTRLESAAYIDGNGRTRETQTHSPTQNKIIVTAALTDDRGNPATAIDAFALVDNVDGSGWSLPGDRNSPPSNGTNGFATWPNKPASPTLRTTESTYDTANRPTAVTTKWGTTELLTNGTAYLGTRTVTKQMVGVNTIGSWHATTVDGRSRISRVEAYSGTTAPVASGLANAGAITAYTYAYNETANNTGSQTEAGWLTTIITDDATNQTVAVTDMQGRTDRSSDPDAGASVITYDPNGNVIGTLDAASNVVKTSYDALNRPTGRWSGSASGFSTAADTDKLASWTYDANVPFGKGMPATESSWQGGLQYTTTIGGYTGRYQTASSTVSVPLNSPLPNSFEIPWGYSATYSEGGQQLTATSSSSLAGAYTLTTHIDGFGHPDQLQGSGGTNDWYVIGSAFDDLGRTAQRTLSRATDTSTAAAMVRHYGYDSSTGLLNVIQAGWDTTPNDLTGTAWFQYDRYTRDAVGNVKVIEDRGLESSGTPSNTKECFLYDEWHRLTRAHTSPGTVDGSEYSGCASAVGDTIANLGSTDTYDRTWTYDDINRIRSSLDKKLSIATTWDYGNSTRHQILHLAGGRSGDYVYNAYGALVSRNGAVLSYDGEQRLVSYDTSTVDDAYIYTVTNKRLARQHGTEFTLYLPGMEANSDGASTVISWYPTLDDTNIATRSLVIAGSVTVTWNCGSLQNSIVCQAPAATSISPQVPARRRYAPYGDNRTNVTFASTDHGMLGQPGDATSLIYLNNRYYDPSTGSFTSVDALVSITKQPYLYADGNPVTLSDPTGLAPSPCENTDSCPGGTNAPPHHFEPSSGCSTGDRVDKVNCTADNLMSAGDAGRDYRDARNANITDAALWAVEQADGTCTTAAGGLIVCVVAHGITLPKELSTLMGNITIPDMGIEIPVSFRGGTTFGNVYITKNALDLKDADKLHHELVHSYQWAAAGSLQYAALYLAESIDSVRKTTKIEKDVEFDGDFPFLHVNKVHITVGNTVCMNRFEIHAGLSDGDYLDCA